MSEISLRFWQKQWDANRKEWEPDGQVTSAFVELDVDHDGGYGECDYSSSLFVSLKVDVENTEGYVRAYMNFPDREFDGLINEIFNFERDNASDVG
jgi:hypothetical protein